MDQLVQLLIEKAGLTQEQAVKSVQTIKEYIQGQLPPMMHGIVENFMNASAKDNDDFTEPQGEGWKDKAKAVADEAVEKIEEARDEVKDFAHDASEKISDWAGKAEDAAKDAISKLKKMMNEKDTEL